jgi:hypothetical protein
MIKLNKLINKIQNTLKQSHSTVSMNKKVKLSKLLSNLKRLQEIEENKIYTQAEYMLNN